MAEDGAAEREFVVRSAQENDVKFVRLWFTDILGNLKGFAITVDDLEDAIEQGVGFDGSSIEGFARIDGKRHAGLPRPRHFHSASMASTPECRGSHVLRHPHSQRRIVHR